MNKERIQFLIDNLQESLDVEVKNWLNGLSENDDRAHLAKEIIALANHSGGYIFIGFDDEDSSNFHNEIIPKSGECEAFTQDCISSIVQKYITPPFQCSVGMFSRTGSELQHPVIIVPGSHRTPIWAKSGSPDGGSANLKTATVYIRGAGAQSRPPENQDEWEKLIEGLVKSRQSDMLDSIRDIINPPEINIEPQHELLDWVKDSLCVWEKKLEDFPEDSPFRLGSGYWMVAFNINPFNAPNLSDLNEKLDREMPKFSGWPPFTYLHREPISPKPYPTGVEAWIVDPDNEYSRDGDFWRIDREGFGFLLRPFQEDDESYCSNRMPQPEKPCFDWLLPSYRMVEILKFIEALTNHFSDNSANVELMVQYVGMKNRRLECYDFNFFLSDHSRCDQDKLQNTISFPISQIATNMEEIILALLSPVYEQFQFTKLHPNVVKKMAQEALSFR